MGTPLRGLLLACCLTGAALGAPAAGDPPHWAYTPLQPVPVPTTPDDGAAHPVDAFIRSRLAREHLRPSDPADRRTLIRRVTFDLTGLAPTPGEIRAFLDDRSDDAYGAVVDRLLASPRYGERWARHWIDAVHFAETHGHDQDRIRPHAWPYRDYLVGAFNSDVPYRRFVEDQVAGDRLHPGDPSATLALGFLAAGPWDESSLRDIREDTLDRQAGRYLDRDDMLSTVMGVFSSTTVHCARCHDHKFDPVSQRDYYALQAVFAGVERADRAYDPDPERHRRRQELLRRRRGILRGEGRILDDEDTPVRVADWVGQLLENPVRWHPLQARTFVAANGTTLTRQPDGTVAAGGALPDKDTYTLTAPPPGFPVTAIQLEVLADPGLPAGGPGRQPKNGNFHLSEFQLLLFEPGDAEARAIALTDPSADMDQDGWTVRHAIDGDDRTAWGIHPQEGRSHRAVFQLREPLMASPDATLAFVLRQAHGEGHLLGRFRLQLTDAPRPVRVPPAGIAEIAAVPARDRSDDQSRTLATYVLLQQVNDRLAALPAPEFVYAAANEFEPNGSLRPPLRPRPVNVLRRGEVTQPLEPALPGALSCLPGIPSRFDLPEDAEEGVRREALARWLTSADNPLTWRSIVNRVWHHHFGRGLVDTPNDFGRMGGNPSHPELLDWLAVWFRDEAGGSLKALHRLLVTSATYRQSAAVRDPGAGADPDNRLLWRMNRSRLDAESFRDAILQASGRLDLRMGGPGDRQFDLQPGIHVTPRVDYSRFDVDGPAGARRSIYRFLFRTLPDPFMEALDCPAGDRLTPARNNSVTLQQALALWNNALVTRHAEHFAARLQGAASELPDQIRLATEWTWGRPATGSESEQLVAYATRHGLANTCRVLFNSNEFAFVD